MSEEKKPFLPRRESFLDCTGRFREFELYQGPQTDGVVVYAREVDPDQKPGYEFSACSWALGNALGRLRATIRQGISRRYLVEGPDRRLEMLTHRIRGVVGCDGLTIDGRHVPFDWLLTHLQTFEGWKFDLRLL